MKMTSHLKKQNRQAENREHKMQRTSFPKKQVENKRYKFI